MDEQTPKHLLKAAEVKRQEGGDFAIAVAEVLEHAADVYRMKRKEMGEGYATSTVLRELNIARAIIVK